MGELVELDVTTVEESVTVNVTEEGQVDIAVLAETGPAGPAGPNSVTSATTSDGTAELLVSNIISGQGVGSQARITGVNQNENSIIGGYFESYVAEAVVGISRDGVGVVGTSENNVGVRASSQQGDYSAQFENDFTPQSAIERVRGWFVWFYNAFTGRLKTADITANRDWTLPDRTGNIALTEDYTAGTATIDVLNATVQGTLTANHIHGNIAGSVYAHVRAGENLAKGDPVYVSGFHAGSGYAEVSKADASNAAKMPAVGVMDAAVLANNNGHMVITGTISDLDTDDYAINATLYVAEGGGWTDTPPAANSQPVAIVERSNQNNGAVIVKVNGLASSGGNGASDANKLARFSSTGTLPIANIGGLGANVATFLATPTSSNLAAAVTDETGSGSLVFSNAPTFTGGLQFSTSAVATTTRTNLGVLQTRSVTKASDETRTSTTFAADSDLVISLEANSTYKIELYYFHTITTGTISARADYTGTLLDTLAGDTCGVYHGTSSGRWTWATVSPPVTTSWANGSATTPAAWIFTFSVKTDTAGNFRLMWSAGNGAGGSSGTAIVKQGSRIIATKLL